MLRSLKDLDHYAVSASDGDIGHVADFLLDDERWTVRYLVVETGGFLDRREVLISPISFRDVEWAARRFHLGLTVEKVKHSPSIDTDEPVSRQHEHAYSRYYGYPMYWGYADVWGMGMYPGLLAGQAWNDLPLDSSGQAGGDVHLRSAKEVRGYHIQGSDDAIGHVDDFIVDDETWGVRYLVIDTSNWWLGKKVLVSPDWIDTVSWEDRKVHVAMSRHAVKNSPEWNGSGGTTRDYEEHLYDYYGRQRYWASDERAGEARLEYGAMGHRQ